MNKSPEVLTSLSLSSSPDSYGAFAFFAGLVEAGRGLVPVAVASSLMAEAYGIDEMIHSPRQFAMERFQLQSIEAYAPLTPVILTKKTDRPPLFRVALEAGLALEDYETCPEFTAVNSFKAISSLWKPLAEVPPPPSPATGEDPAPAAARDRAFLRRVLSRCRERALAEGKNVHLCAQLGWSHSYGIGNLHPLKERDYQKAGRVVWQRTPEG